MSKNPIFDTVAAEYPGIHRASFLFPEPPPEPYISFIRERGAWENVKGIALGALSILTPSRAPHLWP
jgi:hypothetical protein